MNESFASDFVVVLQLLLAVLLGGIVGYDRERAQKPAGLRTHMLVSGSAAFFVYLGYSIELYYVDKVGDAVIRSDPVRVIGAIITGISFLGAGTILRNREGPVEGLTTAASLLFAATIGIAVGVEAYVLAIATTFIAVLILVVGFQLERWLGMRELPEERLKK